RLLPIAIAAVPLLRAADNSHRVRRVLRNKLSVRCTGRAGRQTIGDDLGSKKRWHTCLLHPCGHGILEPAAPSVAPGGRCFNREPPADEAATPAPPTPR